MSSAVNGVVVCLDGCNRLFPSSFPFHPVMRLNDADARSVIVFIHYCRTVYMQTLKTVNNRLTLHATCLGTQLRATKDFFSVFTTCTCRACEFNSKNLSPPLSAVCGMKIVLYTLLCQLTVHRTSTAIFTFINEVYKYKP